MLNRYWPTLVASIFLAGCAAGGDGQSALPVVATPAVFKETGPWTPATPGELDSRGVWWEALGDSKLSALEQSLEKDSPRLAISIARYEQARALAGHAQADLVPHADLRLGSERTLGLSPASGVRTNYTDSSMGVSASYELDVWGRLHKLVASGNADADASAADLAAVAISLHAELADSYFQMRGLDANLVLLHQTQNAYEAALKLTNQRYAGGAASELDVARARTQLATVQSEIEQKQAERAAFEHAIAVLLGQQASTFSIAPDGALAEPVSVPTSTPSRLLQRRPDIAAAQRRLAAANFRVGAAESAFFPDIVLGLSGGFESNHGQLFSAQNKVWALGPVAAMLPLFDGGARKADLAHAKAAQEELAAQYRQVTLSAFREVEDQLALVNRLAVASSREKEAVAAAMRARELAAVQYREGAADYLQVVSAQAEELRAKSEEVSLHTRRLVGCVDLVRALGGAWSN